MQGVCRVVVALMMAGTLVVPTSMTAQASPVPSRNAIVEGKRALAAKQFLQAKTTFAGFLLEHPDSLEGQIGLADAELGLHEYEAAELQYRRVVAVQPEMWSAHKNLVVVEAALDRWDEFDRERALLRGARQRGAPGITARESDVIDGFMVRGQRWIVREYFEPVGRSLTRYNFEHFSPDGKAEEYISLESAEAAQRALTTGDVRIGTDPGAVVIKDFALNWYTGKAHGTVARYASGEPSYERVRADVLRWLRRSIATKPADK